MLLISFLKHGQPGLGVLDSLRDEVCDLSLAAPQLPADMLGLIALGADGLAQVRDALVSGAGRLNVSDIQLTAPIPRPSRNLFCVGKNYREHVKEVQSTGTASGAGGDAVPERPIIFTKATSSVIGPHEPIPAWLDPTQSVDYEGELGVVIGRGGRGIKRTGAMDHVYGYTIVNDVTSRRMQRHHQQWFLGKSIDGFCPMGPAIATAEDIPDVTRLQVRTWVNGELRQEGCVADLIFDIPTLIETLSQTMTLEPGDIIATGTPAGVGMGFQPPRFLVKGDVVSITIEPIGTLENPVT
jgi:2-keto-4-pentenoate hydratase/2-oxohepta-3-ene-1,7-dioic acid hydratase in catechol pathway